MDIRIIGVTLGRTLRNQYAVIEDRLLRGAVVRIAVIAPVCRVLEEAASRTAIPDTPELFDGRLHPTLLCLTDWPAVRDRGGWRCAC